MKHCAILDICMPKRYCIAMILLCVALCPLWAKAAEKENSLFDVPCQRFNVPKNLVIAIAKTESSLEPWVVNIAGRDFHPRTKAEALALIHAAHARKLSHDIGLMQINNWWLERLRIAPEIALEPKNNILIGTWILAQEIQRHGYNWKAVGAYHSKNTARQQHYARAVAKRYTRIAQ